MAESTDLQGRRLLDGIYRIWVEQALPRIRKAKEQKQQSPKTSGANRE